MTGPGSSATGRGADWMAGLGLALVVLLPALRVILGVPSSTYLVPLVVLAGVAFWRLTLQGGVRLPSSLLLYLGSFMLFGGWLCVSVFWTISWTQYRTDFILLGSVATVLGAGTIALNARGARVVLGSLIAAGAAISVWIVLQYVYAGTLRGYRLVFSDDYLTIATVTGAATVALGTWLTVTPARRWRWALLLLVLLVGLGLSLARGAIVFAFGILLLAALYTLWRPAGHPSEPKARGTKGRAAGAAVLLGAIAVSVPVALSVERTATRFARLLTGAELVGGGRGELWSMALSNVSASPVFGYGLGANGLMSGASDRLYPHNLFLQVWLDGGAVGVILLAVTLSIPLYAGLRREALGDRAGRALYLPLLAVYIFYLLELSKSTNFYSARHLFMVGLAAIWATVITRDASTEERTLHGT